MEFIVGGKAQGKLDYVLKKYGLTEEQVCDGAVCTPEELAAAPAVNHFHEFIRRFPQRCGGDLRRSGLRRRADKC